MTWINAELTGGHHWQVAISDEEKVRLDDLLARKQQHGAMILKGDTVTVLFNGANAPLSAADVRSYAVVAA